LVSMITAVIGTNSIVQFLTVLFIFVFVLAITYFTTRFVGNYQKNTMMGSNIIVLETLRISSTKYIQIIKVGTEKCFVISVCKDTVTLLGEVDESTLSLSDKKVEGFKDILEKFKVKSKDDQNVK